MHLNVKFLQVLFTIYISFESINSGDSNKIISIFLILKIQFLKSNIQLFSSNTYLHQQLQPIRMERENQQTKYRKKII